MNSSFLCLVSFNLLLSVSFSQLLRGFFIDCGANNGSTLNGLQCLPDTGYISPRESKIITVQGLIPVLATVQSFPLQNNIFKKFCYEFPVDTTRMYLVRTMYYYGGVNENANHPVFDQIVDGSLCDVVNMTADYVTRSASYYEGIFIPRGKN